MEQAKQMGAFRHRSFWLQAQGFSPSLDFQGSNDQIIEEVNSSVSCWISKVASTAGLLTISVIDMKGSEPSRKDATHRFYVVIDKTACYVSRIAEGYLVEPDRQNPYFAQELDIRERVLDAAIQHFSGESTRPDSARKNQIINRLLEGSEAEVPYPVVRDERPELLTLGAGALELQAERQWRVQIGDHSCAIGLFGEDDNGNPHLVVLNE